MGHFHQVEDVLLQVSLDDSLLEVDNTDVAEDRSLLEGIASLLVVFGIVLRKAGNEVISGKCLSVESSRN